MSLNKEYPTLMRFCLFQDHGKSHAGIVKAAVFGAFEDLKFKISEG